MHGEEDMLQKTFTGQCLRTSTFPQGSNLNSQPALKKAATAGRPQSKLCELVGLTWDTKRCHGKGNAALVLLRALIFLQARMFILENDLMGLQQSVEIQTIESQHLS